MNLSHLFIGHELSNHRELFEKNSAVNLWGKQSVMRVMLWGSLLVLLLLTLAKPAVAQEILIDNPNIEMSVTAGWDGYRKLGDWIPVQVTLQNNGTAVETVLSINSGTGRPNYTLPVSLPNQSNKQVELYVYLPNAQRNLIVNLQDEASGDIIEQMRTAPLVSLDDDSVLYGVVTSQPDIMPFLGRLTAGRAEVGVAYLQLDDLPSESAVWDALDVLILHDVDTNQLGAEQREALRAWVGLGGQLVVTGGPNWQRTSTAVLDLLPVTPTGLESFEDLPSLNIATGQLFRDPGPYLVTISTLSNGELLLREGELPLLAKRAHGRGAVYFLALDPTLAPLRDWNGSEQIWQTFISDQLPRTPVWGQDFNDENAIRNAAESLPSLELPSTLLFMLFLCSYVFIVGPGTYFALTYVNRKELAWVTIPVTIFAFTAVAYISGQFLRGNNTLVNQVSLVYGHSTGEQARFHTAVSVYSPRRSSYQITVNDQPLLRDLDQFSGSLSNKNISQGINSQIDDLLVDVGGLQSFAVKGYRDTPPLTGEVIFSGDASSATLEITVTNNGNNPLERAMLLINDESIAIGDLQPGETRTLTKSLLGPGAEAAYNVSRGQAHLTPVTPGFTNDPLYIHYTNLLGTTTYYGSDDRTVYPRYQLLQSLTDYYSSSAAGVWQPEGIVTLIGWGSEPFLDVRLDNNTAVTTATTLYLIELPYRR